MLARDQKYSGIFSVVDEALNDKVIQLQPQNVKKHAEKTKTQLISLSSYRLSETKEIRTLVHYDLATLKIFLLVA